MLTMDDGDIYDSMMVCEPSALALSVSPGGVGVAVFDSATVRHIGNHASQFEPGSLHDTTACVKVAGGQVVQALKEGVLRLPGAKIRFTQALLVPQCPRILISEGRMDDGGCSITRDGGRTLDCSETAGKSGDDRNKEQRAVLL